MFSPKKKPQDFGFKKGDSHVVVNGKSNTAKAYDFDGKLLWEIPCLPEGQFANWRVNQGDTPPGLYKVGTIYNDYAKNPKPAFDRTLMAFGWISFDLVELENQEAGNGRAGIMMHGGGSGNGWPGAWEPKQRLLPTHGCVRFHNQDLRDRILPLTKTGRVFVSVYQES